MWILIPFEVFQVQYTGVGFKGSAPSFQHGGFAFGIQLILLPNFKDYIQ